MWTHAVSLVYCDCVLQTHSDRLCQSLKGLTMKISEIRIVPNSVYYVGKAYVKWCLIDILLDILNYLFSVWNSKCHLWETWCQISNYMRWALQLVERNAHSNFIFSFCNFCNFCNLFLLTSYSLFDNSIAWSWITSPWL